jgi:hypothetical protein
MEPGWYKKLLFSQLCSGLLEEMIAIGGVEATGFVMVGVLLTNFGFSTFFLRVFVFFISLWTSSAPDIIVPSAIKIVAPPDIYTFSDVGGFSFELSTEASSGLQLAFEKENAKSKIKK